MVRHRANGKGNIVMLMFVTKSHGKHTFISACNLPLPKVKIVSSIPREFFINRENPKIKSS